MQDMSISEVLRDPLIRLMLKADGTSLKSFELLLEKAAYDQAISQLGAQAVSRPPESIYLRNGDAGTTCN